jgi:hypothetical protein
MTTRISSRYLKLAAALAVVASAILFAGITLNPADQPPVTVAPYAIKDFDLVPDGTKAYRPWYENGAWQGDLIEYDICYNDPDPECGNGQRRTDAQVGSNPPQAGLNNWMARATFAQKEDPDGDGVFTDYWKERSGGRHIITYDGSKQVDFIWSKLTDDQKKALDIAAFNSGGNSSDMLDFLRGDHSNERSFDGPYRIRFSLLGDIINSWPVYLGAPKESLNITGFRTFRDSQANRDGRIFVGANDGMLHAFDEDDGSEAWAYIPSMLILDPNDPYQLDQFGNIKLDADGKPIIKTSKLRKLAALPYLHTYYVDGQITVSSAQRSGAWLSALAGGLGAGGKGMYILDVTDDDPQTNKVLFELTGSEFGHIYGRPRIARRSVPDGAGGQTYKWYVITGNGYGSDDGQAKLLMISLDDGSVESILALDSSSSLVADGLSAPVLIDSTGDFAADFAYAGDTNGDMWKFNLNNTALKPVKIYDGNANQPITTAPTVGLHPAGGHMVFFGTGSAASLHDARDESTQQALLAIWDSAPPEATDIVEQTLVQISSVLFTSTNDETGGTTSNKRTVRYIPNATVDESGIAKPKTVDYTTAKGWKINFPLENKSEDGEGCGTSLGERIIGPPQLRAGRVSVVTTNPPGLNCDDNLVGNSWLLSLGYLTGSEIDALGQPEVVFNLSGDDLMNEDDMISTLSPPKPPVGIKLGDGNIAQPTFARLGLGADIMLINGLRLPLPTNPVPGPFLSGHIDVETDSPAGGSSSPNGIWDMSEGYDNESINDKLGKAIDGHVHDYDTIHGVPYVDIFQLEPRRGKASLTPTKKELYSDNTCESGSIGVPELDENGNPVKDAATGETILAGCLDVIDAELNRGYDTTLANPDDPESGVNESEVYVLGTEDEDTPERLPESDQQFIVVLANADLSPAGTLQIGCRIWNVVAYQDMITEQLEALEAQEITDMSLLKDTNNSNPDRLQQHVATSLVFTLKDIANDETDSCAFTEDEVRNLGVSREPTLRIGFNTFSILNGGIHGTRSQCVLGLHDARPVRNKHDKVCYYDRPVHAKAKGAIKNPLHDDSFSYDSCLGFGSAPGGEPLPEDYIRKPSRNLHITNVPNVKGSQGYRWRNGALMLQLLAVESNQKAFSLQPPEELLEDGTTTAKYLPSKGKNRFGGTYARAFKFKMDESTTTTCTTDPLDPTAPPVCTDTTTYGKPYFYINDDPAMGEVTEGPDESGMLYEATMYWHYSALADVLRRADPASIPCYGDPNYGSALKQELGGLTLGEYNKLIADLGDPNDANSPIAQYAEALQALHDARASGDEAEINQALLDLGNLLDKYEDVGLKTYDRFRDYAPGHIPEQHLLDIDKGQLADSDGTNSSTEDGTPEDVETLEDLDTETIGPNFELGRRTWIDLRQ